MINHYPTLTRLITLLCAITISQYATAQNLIVNPGAESGAPATTGWTAIASGSSCSGASGWRIQGNQTGYPVARSGSYIFFPGCGGLANGSAYELRQDVNVTAFTAAIDANKYSVTFAGFFQTYNQTPSDQVRIIVEYRNAANTASLATYNSGALTSPSVWQQLIDTRFAPIGTRFIRVRLFSISFNGDAVDGYFDDISLTATNLLPVNLLQFNATKQAETVSLLWSTDNEANNKGFNILRSADGNNWTTIAFVPAQHSPNAVKTYSFRDPSPLAETNFYQLQQLDLDGKSSLSAIKSLQLPVAGKIFVYPNPVANTLFVKTPRGTASLEILTPQGQVIRRQIAGNSINTSSLKPGTYILKIQDRDQVEMKQFIKQ